MKVVHVLKRIETIDQDIKELKKLEKSIASNKSFSTPIFISIEQQINLLLDERIKLFNLEITNPPPKLLEAVGETEEEFKPLLNKKSSKKTTKKSSRKSSSSAKNTKSARKPSLDDDDDLPMPMLTQDQIDAKIDTMSSDSEHKSELGIDKETLNDDSVKLLDIALDKGVGGDENALPKEKKRVRFFKDNFPGGNY
ncbi:MAG: hypothetical protein PF637_04595 [Spirochaetes bacterium]|jgi:sugar-specific transcriptional regulator TrmB|nr:hypothetical protein [Spirochaetota bacterium]